MRSTAWLWYGRKYESPVRPDRLLWVDPDEIVHKIIEPPGKRRIPPPVVAGGEWDLKLEPVSEDIVYETFYRRYVNGCSWEDSGYVAYLQDDESEHGDVSTEEALSRCESIDRLYDFIKHEGYKTQAQLESESELIEDLTPQLRPPIYREVSINITREGELVWHGGMHRLVISKLLDIGEIPVRVNARHEKWQDTREKIYVSNSHRTYHKHPDIGYFFD